MTSTRTDPQVTSNAPENTASRENQEHSRLCACLKRGEWVTGLDKTRAEQLLDFLEALGESGIVRLDGEKFAVKVKGAGE